MKAFHKARAEGRQSVTQSSPMARFKGAARKSLVASQLENLEKIKLESLKEQETEEGNFAPGEGEAQVSALAINARSMSPATPGEKKRRVSWSDEVNKEKENAEIAKTLLEAKKRPSFVNSNPDADTKLHQVISPIPSVAVGTVKADMNKEQPEQGFDLGKDLNLEVEEGGDSQDKEQSGESSDSSSSIDAAPSSSSRSDTGTNLDSQKEEKEKEEKVSPVNTGVPVKPQRRGTGFASSSLNQDTNTDAADTQQGSAFNTFTAISTSAIEKMNSSESQSPRTLSITATPGPQVANDVSLSIHNSQTQKSSPSSSGTIADSVKPVKSLLQSLGKEKRKGSAFGPAKITEEVKLRKPSTSSSSATAVEVEKSPVKEENISKTKSATNEIVTETETELKVETVNDTVSPVAAPVAAPVAVKSGAITKLFSDKFSVNDDGDFHNPLDNVSTVNQNKNNDNNINNNDNPTSPSNSINSTSSNSSGNSSGTSIGSRIIDIKERERSDPVKDLLHQISIKKESESLSASATAALTSMSGSADGINNNINNNNNNNTNNNTAVIVSNLTKVLEEEVSAN